MAMNQAFFTGVSGVKTMQYGINVTSDNIANVNTVGFKQSRTEFESLFHKALVTGAQSPTSDAIGVGSSVGATTLDFNQGSFLSTDKTFDLAIGGNGFFGLQGAAGVGDYYYSRDGAFGKDSADYLVNNSGEYLLGTLANNIAETTLTPEQMQQYGTYIDGSGTDQPYEITPVNEIALGEVGAQDKIFLPSFLYYPPTATENIAIKAVLDSDIIIEPVDIPINSDDYVPTVDESNKRLDIAGTIATTQGVVQPKVGDLVSVQVTDSLGYTSSINAYLSDSTNPSAISGTPIAQENAIWSVNNYSLLAFDLTTPLTYEATVRSEQESRTTSTFTTDAINSDGTRSDIVVQLEKRVPQPATGSQWDATANVTKFYEDYVVEPYDPTKTYDPAVYDVDVDAGTVTKIYDPAQYVVDKNSNKVYEIISSQSGEVTFNANGALLTNTLTQITNGDSTITLNLGTPLDPTIPLSGYDGVITRSGRSETIGIDRDGVEEGFLTQYDMGNDGDIVAGFTNGKTSPVAKVAIYHFQNEQGLTQVGGQKFQVSSNSGAAIFYKDANGNSILGAELRSRVLETSNVDLSNALTNLIINQRALDANAKSITTGDELIQKALQMGA
ncbi:MAG: flagellar hook-basal body complex protein [Campylobacterota bacterium]|nr:flagellar hook-basal body complex protein [Campylobacterota bacterium]